MRITFRPNRFGRSLGRKIGDLYDDYVKEVFVSACAINKRQVDIVLHTQDRCSFGEPFFSVQRRETLGPCDPFSRRNASASENRKNEKIPHCAKAHSRVDPQEIPRIFAPSFIHFWAVSADPLANFDALGIMSANVQTTASRRQDEQTPRPPVWSTKVGFKIGFN